MHQFAIAPEILRRIKRRRGRLHIYDRLEPARTALLVIDMQNHFVGRGQPGEVPVARGIVGNINALATVLRQAGGTVAWIRTILRPRDVAAWSVFLDHFYTAAKRGETMRSLAPGGSGIAFWRDLDIREADWRVTKRRFSALIQGSSTLERRLRGAGIDTLLIAGTLTQVCCESTARDAMMRNFKVIMLGDANATYTDAEHNASLGALFQVICDVMTTQQVVRLLAAERRMVRETSRPRRSAVG
jgi:ureidoacrylate peracid hydrolase